MKVDNIRRADLDNLAKPVLDTLFKPRNAQVKIKKYTGALFDNVDDDRVFTLTLSKQCVLVALDEGVDITVTWKIGTANNKSTF
jgi:hypothetical protein